jgi:predicted NAD/FAD-binding protein
MNNIQHLATEKHSLFLTLNPPSPSSPERALGHYAYHTHPVLSTDGVRAQRRFVWLNARAIVSGRHRAFASAWSRYGFHEDGYAAGLRAAAVLPGIAPPFAIMDADG